MAKSVLAVFDFDHTVIDDNSDIVAKGLVPSHAITDEIETLRSMKGWTQYMQEIFNLLHSFEITEEEIRNSIVKIPPVSGMLDLFVYLNSLNCDIIIVSDSNTYFIDEWVKVNGLVVNEVFSNPASFKDGKLHIEKYHVQNWCKLSSVNLCKGHILETYVKRRLEEGTEYDFIAYVGDGHNDLCPSLKLGSNDLLFPREGYALVKLCKKEENSIKAKITPWDDASTIVRTLESICR